MKPNELKNITFNKSLLSRLDREKLNNHSGVILWFTGLSGSGKSTLANAMEKSLYYKGCHTVVIDGDTARNGLCSDLGFSPIDRTENIRRVSEVAKLFKEAGLITLVALISPLRKDRTLVRAMFTKEDFIEIYCNSSLDICEMRDVKGLYAKARKGLIPDFTGISSPYEPPINPDILIDTARQSIDESVNEIMNYLASRKLIGIKQLKI